VRSLTYLGLLLGCIALTAPLDVVYRTRVLSRPWLLIMAITPTFLTFLTWDAYAISRNDWTYDTVWMAGLLLPGHVPLEEALFFLVVPMTSILTFEAVRSCLPARSWLPRRPARLQDADQ
jgi:lycopene cyclase domain-containing protein